MADGETSLENGDGLSEVHENGEHHDSTTELLDDDPELEAIKARVREMEEEAEKLKQMQSEVEKQPSIHVVMADGETSLENGDGLSEVHDNGEHHDSTTELLDDEHWLDDPELEAIKARVREIEEEAEKLKQMQSEVEKQILTCHD